MSAEPAAPPAPPEQLSSTQNIVEIWRSLDLNGLRATLDKQGLDIADRQEKSSAARKQLTVSTRSFKSSMSDHASISKKDVGNLLKLYQTEVDALTNRSKSAESSFLSLYKALYDVPDPVEELLKSAQAETRISDLEDEIVLLKQQRTELVERTAAADVTQQKVEELEAKLASANDRIADEARIALEDKQAQWMSAQQKTIEAYEMREQELLHQLRLSNESSRRLQNASDDFQIQLNESKAQIEDMRSSRANINEMAVEDLERMRAEEKILRRRCLELENQLAGQSGEGGPAEGIGGNSEFSRTALSAELAARDVEVSQLKDQVSALEEVLGGKDQEKRNEFAKLSAAITEKDEQLKTAREKLEQLPTLNEYQTMTRQFETLKSFQLLESEFDAEGSTGEEGNKAGSGTQTASETLEKRLLAKVKSLEGRLTRMRVEVGEKDSRIAELKNAVRAFEDQVIDHKELISKLEAGISAMTGDNASVHTLKRRAAAASRGEVDNLSADASGADDSISESTWDWGEKHQAEGLRNIIQEEPSMLDIVSGQRDRFRYRIMELEDDNRKLMERIERLTSDIDSMKSDNVRLYEKIRFVQSYKQSSRGGSFDAEAAPVADEEEGGGFLGKYRSIYEDMVNPYTIFNRRERHKRMSEMSAPERLTLRASQRALSTKTSRLIVFFYIIALHILVALVLGFSASNVCDQDVTTKAQH